MTTPSAPSTPNLVTATVAGEVATITLDSPHNRNALSVRLRSELAQCLAAAIDDDAVRVIVVTHLGPTFCSGADISEMRSGRQATDSPEISMAALIERVWTSPKPILAVLAGPARAGGLGLSAACDVVVAADTVTFALPEVHIGAVPAVISAPLATRVQSAPLRQLMLTGRRIDARRAAEIGLVDVVSTPTDLATTTAEYVEAILQGAPCALSVTRALTRPAQQLTRAQLDELQTLSLEHFAGNEAREGMRAFAEKRRPTWSPATPVQTAAPESAAGPKKSASTQERIIESFTRHVTRDGFDGTKLSAIAAELGISQGTIVHHFRSKQGLLARMHEQYMAARLHELHEIIEALDTPEEQLVGIAYSWALAYRYARDETIASQREVVRLSDDPMLADSVELRRQYMEHVVEIIAAGSESGVFRASASRLDTLFLFGSSQWMWTWYQVDGDLSPEDIATHIARAALWAMMNDRDAIEDLVVPDGVAARTVERILTEHRSRRTAGGEEEIGDRSGNTV